MKVIDKQLRCTFIGNKAILFQQIVCCLVCPSSNGFQLPVLLSRCHYIENMYLTPCMKVLSYCLLLYMGIMLYHHIHAKKKSVHYFSLHILHWVDEFFLFFHNTHFTALLHGKHLVKIKRHSIE